MSQITEKFNNYGTENPTVVDANLMNLFKDAINDTDTKLSHFYNVGSIYISSKNENPSSKFGGTWELIDKEFEPGIIADNLFTPNATNIKEATTTVIKSGHTIRIRLNLTTNVEIGSANRSLGTFNVQEAGITSMHYYYNGLLGFSSDGTMIMMLLLTDKGAATSYNVICKSGTTAPAGSKFYFDFTFPVCRTAMINSACNKFYWKRTK